VIAVFNLGADAPDVSVAWREVDALRDTHFAESGALVLRDLISGEQ
jgi:hypothetical protein